jgi:AcrR family transcriptional regulator
VIDTEGRRARSKRETRERIADAAARLFAEHGYDGVAMRDVARAADVSEQTLYNYFPTKEGLVLDRADEYRERYAAAVANRDASLTPADALRPLIAEDLELFVASDPAMARGEFPAQCVRSPLLRRFALELRDEEAAAIADALRATDPGLDAWVARAHAAALVAVLQAVTDRIGAGVLEGSHGRAAAGRIRAQADRALDDLRDHFVAMIRKGR